MAMLSLRFRVVRRVADLKHGFLRDGEECEDDVVGGIGIVGLEGSGQHVVVLLVVVGVVLGLV